ncbi:aldehyde dehydrogenase family protein [Micromonospora aurantiaca]|uniref:aldehyde dehydrogenase family protein n=1 Tax=Micromonospora aurantiaca (nom. illeg.) TaxID=47850 RepID=UPI003451F6F3
MALTMTVDGRPAAGAGTFDVVDPATGAVFATAPACPPELLDRAMGAATAAYPGWAHDDEARRGALRAAARAVLGAVADLAALVTAEQGKPLAEATTEVRAAAAWLHYFAGIETGPQIVDGRRDTAIVTARPLGVVAAVTPWNYPLALAAWKIAPALRAGNTVVLKPSPHTPLATLALGELLRDLLPPGVLNVVTGPDPLGAWLCAHPVPRKITFTGSTATGRRVAAEAAARLRRVTLELGGNDAALVLDDADPARIADDLFWAAFANSGQMCMAVKRVYVARPVHDALVEALADRAATVPMGPGADPGVRLGPVTTRAQQEYVAGLVRAAVAGGATVVAGVRAADGPGHFHPPTVLSGVSDTDRVVTEEQFGPVLPVLAFDDVEEALTRADATPFGLTASVWSADPDRAAAVAARLDVGQVSVNAHAAGVRPDLPFGGRKDSGPGVENGHWGLAGYTQPHVLVRPPSDDQP